MASVAGHQGPSCCRVAICCDEHATSQVGAVIWNDECTSKFVEQRRFHRFINGVASRAYRFVQALALNVPRSAAALLANRSAAHLQLGRKEQALEDARGSVAAAPRGFHTAQVRLIDALYACGQIDEAKAALAAAMKSDSGFSKIPEYPAIAQALAAVDGKAQAATAPAAAGEQRKWGWFGKA